jgi:hypothetical protein
MSIPSNLYAEKVFAEHPLGLWALDEKVDFISLINNRVKKLEIGTLSSQWTLTGGTTGSIPATISSPILDSPIKAFSVINASELKLVSNNVFSGSILDTDKNTFTIGAYLLSLDPNADTFSLGYKYGATEVWQNFDVETPGYWQFVSTTTFSLNVNTTASVMIKVTNSTASTSDFIVNGLSVGQWSENFNSESTGVTTRFSATELPNVELIDLPTTINLATSKAVYANAYGIGIDQGYYLASSNKLYAYNDGVPMVYGANSVTKIVPRPNNLPSLILPGFGFMNKSGQYQDLTFETWLRIKTAAIEPRRIFGPINSEDGLYVDGAFLILKIGDYKGSYQIGEWDRPMLIQIRLSNNSASLLINGEQVINLITNTASIIFPPKLAANGKDQDWLGFYAYADVPLIEIDCPAIYSYSVPELLAKKRFVYGQGVLFPLSTQANLDSYAAFIDYKFAKYSNNYLYPDMGVWNRGIKDNVKVTRNTLETPDYSLPDIVLDSTITTDEWLRLCQVASDSVDSSSFVNLGLVGNGYMVFNNFDFLSEDSIRAFYGVFTCESTTATAQILFKIIDEVTGNYLSITVENNAIVYSINYGGISTQLYSEPYIVGTQFLAGIDLDNFINYYENNLASFFSAKSRLKVYIGGQQSFSQTFKGRIHNVSFLNRRNLSKIDSIFNTDTGIIITNDQDLATTIAYEIIFINGGLPATTAWDSNRIGGDPSTTSWTETLDAGITITNNDLSISTDAQDHIASYTLKPTEYLNNFDLDIATDSYWQDYIPLKGLGKLIKNELDEQVYGLSYVQFNVDYPTLRKFTGSNYNLSDANVRTYVSFQYISAGANKNDQTLSTVALSNTNVVIPGSEWTTSKYEVTNDTILYMPPSVDFRTLAFVTHIDISSNGILTKPMKIKNMQFAGQALDRNKATPINTRFGISLYPYLMNSIYFNYSAKNPVNIYKQSTPHLYLTDNSGILLRELTGSSDERGITLPINYNKLNDYSIGGIQLTMKYEKSTFPDVAEKIFEIYCKTNGGTPFYIEFYIQSNANDDSRGRVYAINSLTDTVYTGLNYYMNGTLTKNPNIFAKEWNILSLEFFPGLNFGANNSNFTGNLNITSQLLINNIAVQQAPEIETYKNVRVKIWSETNGEYPNWLSLVTTSTTWQDLLFEPVTQSIVVNTQDIYKNYTQSRKAIVSDNIYTVFGDYKYATYNDVTWKTVSVNAA